MPMQTQINWGVAVIENSSSEKYLGYMIEEKGCAASITETIKERIRSEAALYSKRRAGYPLSP